MELKLSVPVMTQHKQSPKHGPLSHPVRRPHGPMVQICRSRRHRRHNNHVPHDVAHRPRRALDPAVGRDSGPDLRDLERRRPSGLKLLPLPCLIRPQAAHLWILFACSLQCRPLNLSSSLTFTLIPPLFYDLWEETITSMECIYSWVLFHGPWVAVINGLLSFASHGRGQRFHGPTRVSCFAWGDKY